MSGTRLVSQGPCPQLALIGGACCRPVVHTSSPGSIPRTQPQEVGVEVVKSGTCNVIMGPDCTVCVHKHVSGEGELERTIKVRSTAAISSHNQTYLQY